MFVNLDLLRYRYEKGAPDVFEDLCTHLFCVRLELSHVSRRINRTGMEADPVDVGSAVVKEKAVKEWKDTSSFPSSCKCGFQVKYWGPGKAISGHARELEEVVEQARKEGVTDLWLFVNADRTQTTDGEKPEGEKKIEDCARGNPGEARVYLHWWDRSTIQTALGMPGKYSYIRNLYPVTNTNLPDYYEYVWHQYRNDKGDELYGRIPLRDYYIKPTVRDGSGAVRDVAEYVEDRVRKCGSDGSITVICGEPGHGKTSLCRKAVHDFYDADVRWLNGVVSNVLWFSLNPGKTDALLNDRSFNFHSLLSWGNDRTSKEHKVEEGDCAGALVFLDAFDELLEWRPGFDLDRFIDDHVAPFQKETKAHVVITARGMAIGKAEYHTRMGGEEQNIPVLRMQPMSRDEQAKWITRYSKYCEKHPSGLSDAPTSEDWAEYLEGFRELAEDDALQELLGIPAIFRMVVAARFLPRSETSVVQVYDDLFEQTWLRHQHAGVRSPKKAIKKAMKPLEKHALRVYVGDGEGASVEGAPKSPWTFSFYTSLADNAGQDKATYVGFLHRSIYQYFLAREVFSWFRKYAEKKDPDDERFMVGLSYLARGRLDATTLGYIGDIHRGFEESEDSAPSNPFDRAYRILYETDGFLPIDEKDDHASPISGAVPSTLERANNVFWNVLSICGVCGHAVDADKVRAVALRSFDLDGSRLNNARLNLVRLSQANLIGADLRGADLSETHLEQASLMWADLRGAHLQRAILPWADLFGADFNWADLSGADLHGADLHEAHLQRAILPLADLHGADLRNADLHGADLHGADLRDADLLMTDLRGADLYMADLRGADLLMTDLCGADLRIKYFDEVDFSCALTEGATFPSMTNP